MRWRLKLIPVSTSCFFCLLNEKKYEFGPFSSPLVGVEAPLPSIALELELIQTQMAQKPMLRAEVYAHAMRASQNRKKEVRREKEV